MGSPSPTNLLNQLICHRLIDLTYFLTNLLFLYFFSLYQTMAIDWYLHTSPLHNKCNLG